MKTIGSEDAGFSYIPSKEKILAFAVVIVLMGALVQHLPGRLKEWARERAKVAAQEEKIRLAEEEHQRVEAHKLELTRARVTEQAELLDAKRKMGAYVRPGEGKGEDFLLSVKDEYGRPLRVIYNRGNVIEEFKLRSAGPNGIYFDQDDIVEKRWAANGAGAAAGVLDGAGSLLNSAKKQIFGDNEKK